MKITKFSTRDIVMVVFLVVFLIGVLYYMGFYKPLQADLASITSQTVQTDDQINQAMNKAAEMKRMRDELDVILSQPKFQITEIAPYDNKNIVLNMLNGVLGASEEYSLSFTDPEIEEGGTVRRDVSMNFSCRDYDSAKIILRNLTKSNWRCLVRNVSINADGSVAEHLDEDEKKELEEKTEDEDKAYDENDLMMTPVSVSATITFFESTKLTREKNQPLDVTEVEATEAAEEAA